MDEISAAWSTDGIHSLLAEKKIGREQENELYELIGKVRFLISFFNQQFDLNCAS